MGMLFEKDEHGVRRIRPWTHSTPPPPLDARAWAPLTVFGVTLCTLGIVAIVLAQLNAPSLAPIALAAALGGTSLAVLQLVRELRVWWQHMRWANSPPPPDTLDDRLG
jgi:hypothetical protein